MAEEHEPTSEAPPSQPTPVPGPRRQRCEVYTRCVGYLRPIHHMNKGKQAEVRDRKMYQLPTFAL